MTELTDRVKYLRNGRSLEVAFPRIAALNWHPTKNGELKPSMVAPHSKRLIWWKDDRCGHEWQSPIVYQIHRKGCPYCVSPNQRLLKGFNDLATKKPELLSEWNEDKNGDALPSDFLAESTRVVWWRCEKGHEWKAPIARRYHGYQSCPICKKERGITSSHSFPVRCVETGEEFGSMKAAAEAKGIRHPSSVSNACYKPKHTAGGYHWEFVD